MYNKESGRIEVDQVKRNGYEPIAQIENSTTPPAYVVRETSDGRLVNDSFGVEWPTRPPFGRYAEQSQECVSPKKKNRGKQRNRGQTKAMKIFQNEGIKEKQNGKAGNRQNSGSVVMQQEKDKPSDEAEKWHANNDYLFVGAQTLTSVAKLLRQNDFRLYYQMPSLKDNIIPVHIPLCLAYMSAAGKVYHFPIVCTKNEATGRESWRVMYGDPRPSSFNSLAALVKYHKTYSYMDPKTGAIDTFPVWKGAIIDSDDID
ncbi:unnamed protein product [Thelazia callipaeda]|uniref:SH2 domain-containing protein n=1 Tax=Thelazia callipaeda TaxID=103827 RepID=A0A0N5D2H4_THECL|nr:unnamed protein product [Thelazia callipaeda]